MGSKKVVMFAGKGGVGKTTCAAATALHYALEGEETIIISTDFTPSLRDIFECSGNKEEKVAENLCLTEVGYEEVRGLWDKKFGREVHEVFSTFVDIGYTEFTDFVASILPGIRDEFMVDYIRELAESGRFSRIVWDTAPAGQTLGLLRMPSLLSRHLNLAPKVYSALRSTGKRRSVLGVIKEWEALSSRDLVMLQNEVAFNLVSIAEGLSVRQVDNMANELRGNGLSVNGIIVNQVVTEPDSEFLLNRARMQQRYISELEDRYGVDVARLPLFPYEIKGTERLREVEAVLFDSHR